MKITIDTLQDSLQLGYETYAESRETAETIWAMYNNRMYDPSTLETLRGLGQPPETFNVIRMFTRMLIGYYSTVVNTIKPIPKDPSVQEVADLIGDVVQHIYRTNFFGDAGDKVKLDGFLSGLMVSYTNVKDTGRRDRFGRPVYEIVKSHVPSRQVILDPNSTKVDYSDARWIHRFKWVHRDEVVRQFGVKIANELEEYWNAIDIPAADHNRDKLWNAINVGRYKDFEEYLILHTVVHDGDDWYSVYWTGDKILHKKKITNKLVHSPYTVVKLSDSDKVEHQGIFEDVYNSQNAINQALLQIQLMVNTNKVLVETGAVDNIEDFRTAWKKINAIIPVRALQGIRVENMNSEIQQQYIIIEKALERIQSVLGINDSFLGQAFAHDSGRKVKLQQNATIMALRYIDTKLDVFYRVDGWKTIHLVKQYYRAEQLMNIVDEVTGRRWIELNKPIQDPDTGRFFYTEAIDPETGEVMMDKDLGVPKLAPINHPETDLEFADVDLEIQSVGYNDEDEKNQLMLETMLNGSTGNALMTVNPAGFFKAAALNVRTMKTKHSRDISDILTQTAEMLQPQAHKQEELGSSQAGTSPKSQDLKLPQNTNEGA